MVIGFGVDRESTLIRRPGRLRSIRHRKSLHLKIRVQQFGRMD